MSQFRLETEADMLNYLDKDYGHGVGATYTRSGTASSISCSKLYYCECAKR